MFPATNPHLKRGVIGFHETKGTVVQRAPPQGTVVAVEVALAVPHSNPVGHQMRQTHTKLTCHGDDLVRQRHLRAVQGGGQVWIFAVECMQKNRLQLGQRTRVRVVPSPPTKQFDLTNP